MGMEEEEEDMFGCEFFDDSLEFEPEPDDDATVGEHVVAPSLAEAEAPSPGPADPHAMLVEASVVDAVGGGNGNGEVQVVASVWRFT